MRAVLAAAALAILAAPQDAEIRKPERYAGVITAGPLNPAPVAIELGVDRWSTDETRASLFDIFQSGGQPALAEYLKKAPITGYVRMPNHERLQATYVQEEIRPDGGRRILMLCVRFLGDWEQMRETGWTDHLFRIVALTLDGKNKGSGMLFHTARIRFGKDGPDLVDDLSGQPTKILSVQKTR